MSLVTIIWSIFIILASIFTVAANLFVIIAILIYSKLKHPRNYLTLSLAVTDLLYGLVYMPIKGLTNPTSEGNWSYGSFICRSYYLLSWTSAIASILNLVMIAIDRYLSATQVTYILEKRKKAIPIMIFTVWSSAFILSCFMVYTDKDFIKRIEERKQCVYSLNYVTFIALVLGYYIPLILIIILYVLIYVVAENIIKGKGKRNFVHINVKTEEMTDETGVISDAQDNMAPKPCLDDQSRAFSKSDEIEKEIKRREKRLSSVLSLVTGVFIVCWTPTMIAVTVNILCSSCRSSPVFTQYYFIFSSTSAFNSAINPIIYTVFVVEFREAFKKLLTRFLCRN